MASGIVQSIASLFNLAPKTQIPQNSDLNNYKTAGTFYVYSDAVAQTISNMPRSASGTLVVVYRGSKNTYLQQFYLPTTNLPFLYTRLWNSSSWTSWSKYYPVDTSVITDTFTMPEMSLPQNGTASVSKSVAKDGYTPLGIVQVTGSGTSGCNLMEFALSGTTASIWANNNTSTAKYPTYSVTVLYRRA